MSSDIIILAERIKELSHSTGVLPFTLDGAATGFSAFGDSYASGDAVYYAITDGTNYEVGSGVYTNDTATSRLVRFPLRSTNSDAAVPFTAGLKEVYVTYPGQFSVFSASGLGSFDQPQASGLAFWGSSNIVDYDPDLIWDKTNSRMGVGESSPQYALHVGGQESYSQVYSSGSIVGDSGVLFEGVDPAYSGGRQLEPFIRSELNTETGTDGVFALSGLVDQVLLFNTQTAGTVLAGPPSGCTPGVGCPEDYPVFRALVVDDIPDLYSVYVTPISGWASGTIALGDLAVSGFARSYVDSQDHTAAAVSGWASGTIALGDLAVSGFARSYVDSQDHAGAAVSGWASGTFLSSVSPDFTYVSGVAAWASGASLYNWNISDGNSASDTIVDADTVYVSGISGVVTSYNSTSNIMQINAAEAISAASGFARAYADAVSIAAGTYTHWTIHDGAGNSESIGQGINVYVSGISGIDTFYNTTTNVLEVNAASLSGWASGTFLSSVSPDFTYVSGVANWASGAAKRSVAGDVDNGLVTWVTSDDTFSVEPNFTFDGSALQLDGTLTVGVDGTGKDVKFYGDTTGSYLEWDQSEDTLNLVSGVFVNDAVPADDTPTTATAAITLDLSLGSYHNFVIGLSQVRTINFNNAKRGQKFILRLTQHGSAAQTVTAWLNNGSVWSVSDNVYYTGTTRATLRWAGDLKPTMSTSTGHTDVYGFLCTDSLGSKFDAFIVGQDLPN